MISRRARRRNQKRIKWMMKPQDWKKILTGLGVAAAIVIVAVVIVFVLKLGGLFRSSTPEDPTKTVSEEAMTEEAKTNCGIGDCYQPEGSLYAEASGPLPRRKPRRFLQDSISPCR